MSDQFDETNETVAFPDDAFSEDTKVLPEGESPLLGFSPAASEPTLDLAAVEAAEARARQEAEEAARRQAEERAREQALLRAQERADRERALGNVAPPAADVEPLSIPKSTNEKFFPALGLFVLRLVFGILIGVRGVQVILNQPEVIRQLLPLSLPSTDLIALSLGIVLVVLAVMLIFGFGARFAGILVTAIAIAYGVVFIWKSFSGLWLGDLEGLQGEYIALSAAVGFLFATVGAGGWSIDGGIRRSHLERKLYS